MLRYQVPYWYRLRQCPRNRIGLWDRKTTNWIWWNLHGMLNPNVQIFLILWSLYWKNLSREVAIYVYLQIKIWAENTVSCSVAAPGCLFWIRIFPYAIPDSGSKRSQIPGFASASKNLNIFNPKNRFASSRKYDPGCLSRIPIFPLKIFYVLP